MSKKKNFELLKQNLNAIVAQTEMEILVLDDVVQKLADGTELLIGNLKFIKYKGNSKIEDNVVIEKIISQNINYKTNLENVNKKIQYIYNIEKKLKLEYKEQLKKFSEESDKITINQRLLKEFVNYYLYRKK